MLEFPEEQLKSDDDDPQLVIKIPFATEVKVKSINLIGGTEGTHPKKLHIYCNPPTVDFSTLEDLKPTQTLDLVENLNGDIDFPLKISKFSNVSSMALGV